MDYAEPPALSLLICYDNRFPELALLMRQRHGCFLLACSSARPPEGQGYSNDGQSLVLDPWGTVVAEAGTDEQVLHAEPDLAQVARARQAIPTGDQRRGDVVRLEPT